MNDDTEMTPEQEAQLQAAIIRTTEQMQAITIGMEAGVVMSALLSCIMSGAAGTPEIRATVIEHMRQAVTALEAMGELPGEEAIQAAHAATPAGSTFVSDECATDMPPVSGPSLH